jgi:DNA anti-recombination protein RmuC
VGSRAASCTCVENRVRGDASRDASTPAATARGVRAAVGGTSSLSSQQYAAELAELRQRNYELSSQLNEAHTKLAEKNQQLDEIKRRYETMLRNSREEVIETQNQASSSEIDVVLMVRLL